jgi:hypothetical protein
MLSCFDCPASKPEYDKHKYANEAARELGDKLAAARAKVRSVQKKKAIYEEVKIVVRTSPDNSIGQLYVVRANGESYPILNSYDEIIVTEWVKPDENE